MTRQKNGTWKLTDSEMNLFSIVLHESADRRNELGLPATAQYHREKAIEIFEILEKVGYYKEV